MTPTRTKRLYDRDHARYSRVKVFEGKHVEIAPRSYRFAASGRVRCYIHGIRVPVWFYHRNRRKWSSS